MMLSGSSELAKTEVQRECHPRHSMDHQQIDLVIQIAVLQPPLLEPVQK